MQNAHLRMGTLTFVKQTRDTVTDVTVHLNQLVAEHPAPSGPAAAMHLASVFGGDVEIGAVAAAAHEGLKFQIKAPGLALLGTLGEDPVLYRSSLQVPGRKRPVRHLILVSKTLFETTFGANKEARRTVLYDDSPEFVEAGGGSLTDLKGPQLGGLNGFSVKDLPGPAGKGGVGVGSGLGDKPGVGGQGEGLGFRGKGHREALLGTQGGTKASDRAVGAALNWLYRHQTSLGKWSLDFRHQCKNGTCSGPGVIRSDEAATSMALLPFLAYGLTHKSKSIYQQSISKGLTWLIKEQTADGSLASNSEQPMYAQGLATLALCEAYGMTHDEKVGAAARKAVAFIIRAQNPSTGGWRYFPGQPGDTSVTGWQVMALKSAQLAGIAVDSFVFDNAKKWFHSVAKGEHMGLYSYQPYDQVTPTRTAIGMLCTQYFGIDPKDPAMIEGKQYLLLPENLPDDQIMRNSYYWYYATLAMHNFGGPEWDAWNRKMRRVLILSQEKQGCATGSWDPLEPSFDIWGEKGGRLMTTAFNCLTLEVYYRYLPIFQTDSLLPNPPPKPKDIDQDKDGDKVDKAGEKVDNDKEKDEVL